MFYEPLFGEESLNVNSTSDTYSKPIINTKQTYKHNTKEERDTIKDDIDGPLKKEILKTCNSVFSALYVYF